MLLTQAQQLKELLVGLLAERPNMSASELQSEVATRSKIFSRRSIFKELKALEQLGVVVRANGLYALQLIWIINMISLLRGAYVSHLKGSVDPSSAALTGRMKLRFHDLARLDYAWMQLMLVLQQVHPHTCTRVWKPAQWFHLVHEHITENFFSALGRVDTKQHHIIGHDCYTCRYGAGLIPRRFARVKFVADAFGVGNSTYLTLIGDHLITVRLTSSFSQRMHRLFAAIRNKEEMLAPHVLSAMRGRVQSTLVVEYRPKGLAEIRDRFDHVFEESRSNRGKNMSHP